MLERLAILRRGHRQQVSHRHALDVGRGHVVAGLELPLGEEDLQPEVTHGSGPHAHELVAKEAVALPSYNQFGFLPEAVQPFPETEEVLLLLTIQCYLQIKARHHVLPAC